MYEQRNEVSKADDMSLSSSNNDPIWFNSLTILEIDELVKKLFFTYQMADGIELFRIIIKSVRK